MEIQTITIDGKVMAIVDLAELQALIDRVDEEADVRDAKRIRAEIEAGAGTVPGEVMHAMIVDGRSPVAAWRRYRGITQQALAVAANVSQATVNRIEKRRSHGRPATRRHLARCLDAPLWSLDED